MINWKRIKYKQGTSCRKASRRVINCISYSKLSHVFEQCNTFNIQISKAMLEMSNPQIDATKISYKKEEMQRMKTQSLVKESSYCSKLIKLLKREACCWPLLKKISNVLMNYPCRQRQRKIFLFCIYQILWKSL